MKTKITVASSWDKKRIHIDVIQKDMHGDRVVSCMSFSPSTTRSFIKKLQHSLKKLARRKEAA